MTTTKTLRTAAAKRPAAKPPAAKRPAAKRPTVPQRAAVQPAAKSPSAQLLAKPPAALPAKVAQPAKPIKPAKPMKPGKPAESVKPRKQGAAKVSKPAKVRQKPVRDSFTMPEGDFALIATLKARLMAAKRETKKSELLRAGLHALAALDSAALLAALNDLEPVKVGRPKSGH